MGAPGLRKGTNRVNLTNPAYLSWHAMLGRCLYAKQANYVRYGGKGIKVCERWLDFNNFLADMGPRPKGTTLDRIDSAKDYEPTNCRWSTPQEQVRQNYHPLMFNGALTHRKEIARALGITLRGLRWRLQHWGSVVKEV
jgi:hypothetical protein